MNNPTRIALYDKTMSGRIPWPDTEDGRYAQAFLEPMLTESTQHFIDNARTDLYILRVDDLVLPLTVNETEYDNTYVCSPYTHYYSYAEEELYLIDQTWLRNTFSTLLKGLSWVYKRSQINRVVHVNNWLVSTNLYPAISEEQLELILALLRERFPNHAYIFRSLHRRKHAVLLKSFAEQGAKSVGSRQIYVMDPASDSLRAKARKQLRRDLRLAEQQGYQWIDASQLESKDIPRIAYLYRELYIQKYSPCNPQFNERFIQLALEKKLLHFHVLRKDGRIDGVLGYFSRNGQMTTPLLGYDLNQPLTTGLYRMLVAQLFVFAREQGLFLNRSSGAAAFKRYRGAQAEIEYSCVVDRHLPWRRRVIWTVLEKVIRKVGIPLLQKYKL